MTISAPVAVSRFPMIEVAGSHREMGRQIGEATRDLLRELVEVVTDRINVGRAGQRPISNEQALEVARVSTAYAAEYAPELMTEVEGVAEGAGLTVDQVMLGERAEPGARGHRRSVHRGGCRTRTRGIRNRHGRTELG